MGPDESATLQHESPPIGSLKGGRPRKYAQSAMGLTVATEKIRETNMKSSWSISYPSTCPPTNRVGAFSSYIEQTDQVIIGYGNDQNGKLFNDIWIFSFADNTWSRFKVTGYVAEPRTGAKSCIVGSNVFIFGGKINEISCSDFHVINLETHECRTVTCDSGDCPAAREGHVMASFSEKIIIWGGIENQQQLDDLWIYEVSKNVWRQLESSIPGRAHAAYAVSEDKLYITCASRIDDMIIFNFKTEKIDSFAVTGSPPAFDLKGASFHAVGRFLILIGGYIEKQRFSMVRAYDTVRRWWFVFYVVPDDDTTTVADGGVDSNGIFLVPRMYGGFAVFRPNCRQICISLGEPMSDPPPVYIFNVGEGISVMHHQLDILAMLK